MAEDALKQEFTWYLENQDELVKKYEGKFLVIKNQEVIETYDDLGDAVDKTVEQGHEMGTFLVQKCTPGDKDITAIFHSRVA